MQTRRLVSRIALRLAAASAIFSAVALFPRPELFASGPRLENLPRPALTLAPIADVATLLPPELFVVVEGKGLGALAGGWRDSPLAQRVKQSRAWKQFEHSAGHAQLLAGIGFVQLVSGWTPEELLAALLGDQIAIALVPAEGAPGLVAAIQTADADSAEHLVSVVRGMALANKENATPPRVIDHGGVSGLVVNEKLWLAALDRTLVVASTQPLFEKLVDRALAANGPAAVPAPVPPLVASLRKSTSDRAELRFAVDLARLAATRPDGKLLPDLSENSGGALLLGDLLALLRRAPTTAGSLALHGTELALEVVVPGDPKGLPAACRCFAHARADEPLLAFTPRETLLTLTLRRDWSAFFDDHAQLCQPQAEKEFADFKTNLALFFGGQSVPDDLLPQLADELAFVLTRQTYPGITDVPKVKYPAGALVFRTKADATKLGRDFAIGVHSFLALINLDRAMKNQTPFLPFVEPFEGVTVYGGRPLPGDRRPGDPARQNLSPCAAWLGDRIVLSSTEELLHDLVRLLAVPEKNGLVPAGVTSYLRIDGPALAALARDDRDVLIDNAMLNDGKPAAQAQNEADLLAEALRELASATLQSTSAPDGMHWKLALELTPFTPATPASAPAGTR